MPIVLRTGHKIAGHDNYFVIETHPDRDTVALASVKKESDSDAKKEEITRVVKVYNAEAVERLRKFEGFKHETFASIVTIKEDGSEALCEIEKVGDGRAWPSSLAELAQGRKRLPFFAAWIVVRQVAALVAALEPLGGHGDLQPQNLLAVEPDKFRELKNLRVVAIDPLVPGERDSKDRMDRTGDLEMLRDCAKIDRQDLGRLFLFLLTGKAKWYAPHYVDSLFDRDNWAMWFSGARGVSSSDREALRHFVKCALNGHDITTLVDLLDEMRPAHPTPPVYGPGLLVALLCFALPLLLLSCNGTLQAVQHGPELLTALIPNIIRSTPTPTASPTVKPVAPTHPSAPQPTTPAPEPTTPAPEPTTPAPEPTVPTPEPTVPTPEPTTPAPELTTPAPEPTTPAPEPTPPTPSPEQTLAADEAAKGIIFLEAKRGENPSIQTDCGKGAELGKLAGEVQQSYQAKLYIHPLKRNGPCVRVWAPHNINRNGVEGWIALDQVCVPKAFYDRHTAARDELWSIMTGLVLQSCEQE